MTPTYPNVDIDFIESLLKKSPKVSVRDLGKITSYALNGNRPITERLIGSILSVSKMFIDFPENDREILTWDLYLPSISPIYTATSLHVLVLKKEHIYFEQINASYTDFVKIKDCYQEINKYSEKDYVETLIDFATNALNLKISAKTKNGIKKLNTTNNGNTNGGK